MVLLLPPISQLKDPFGRKEKDKHQGTRCLRPGFTRHPMKTASHLPEAENACMRASEWGNAGLRSVLHTHHTVRMVLR